MQSKLFALKEGKNILIYNVVYDTYSLSEYFKYLDSLYGYFETVRLDTTLINNVPISMNEYDYMKDKCRIKDGYNLVQVLEEINENGKRATIEIEIEYYSKISQILKDTFLNSEPLLNATYLIKMMNGIYGLPNNFKYNPIIDLREKGKTWNDPLNLSLETPEKYDRIINEKLNLKNIEFNKLERTDIYNIISGIIDDLKRYLSIEQIGIFPITEKMPDFLNLLTAFAIRNEDAEVFFGSFENININFAGCEIINEKKAEICKIYNLKQNEVESAKVKNKIDIFDKFLQF